MLTAPFGIGSYCGDRRDSCGCGVSVADCRSEVGSEGLSVVCPNTDNGLPFGTCDAEVLVLWSIKWVVDQHPNEEKKELNRQQFAIEELNFLSYRERYAMKRRTRIRALQGKLPRRCSKHNP